MGFIFFSCSQKGPVPFEDIPENYPVLRQVLEHPETYKAQILYTQIDRDSMGNPVFKDFNIGLDDQVYFYPASTVKLPVAILALEWLAAQNIESLTAQSIMLSDSIRPSQIPALVDSSAQNNLPSIAHYIKKILLASDNDAYNRLYELLGQDYINTKLKEKGLNQTIINHRLSMPMTEVENRHFNPIRFVDSVGNVLMEITARETSEIYANTEKPAIGKAYFSNGELVNEPMDFTFKNKFALSNLHGIVQRIIFPENFSPEERFQISESDREFILKYMSMLPLESGYPKYELPEFYDSYSKFFKFGTDKNLIPERFRIFNKTGNAYGHLLDGSYFVDFETGTEFFVSAVIYTNADETLNDDIYEYDSIGFPFFAELGEYLYQLELKRKKERSPDFSEFRFRYK
ncbi:class A beta-lactamase-related serine hydrolase [Aquiflexum sp. TKW24L]|uniref:serine hydrolase n=1 Tax=Aquiflexum sp. TKW24L TaxID=2942212 RepID=UPI0020BEBBDD|nr:serine hydrolase [Aquiflexum sp. TKW24L]MCL6258462.1 class A beta-lactamase-related serine hydrolase [Aquiflexum sp. TKW24L]